MKYLLILFIIFTSAQAGSFRSLEGVLVSYNLETVTLDMESGRTKIPLNRLMNSSLDKHLGKPVVLLVRDPERTPASNLKTK